jgi:hypothetical protein
MNKFLLLLIVPVRRTLKMSKGGNQNTYIEERQTARWPKKKEKKRDKQLSTMHTHKTKDRVTRTTLKPGSELRCSGRVNSSCSTSDTRRVNLDANIL